MPKTVFVSPEAGPALTLVRLRAGNGPPLFCFPGSGGNIHAFRQMVAALPEGPPVYGIDMERLCDARDGFTIEQLGAACLDQIRTIQTCGPYYFCGYSFGGLVAFDMAARLLDEGDGASLVACWIPLILPSSNLSKANSVRYRKTYLLDRLKKYGLHLMQGDLKAFMGRAVAFVTSRTGRLFMPAIKKAYRMINKPLPAIMRSNDPGFQKAWSSYRPRLYPKSIVCFRVEQRGPEHDADPTMGWKDCAVGGVHVHVVPGDHIDIMLMPSVGLIAETLATYPTAA